MICEESSSNMFHRTNICLKFETLHLVLIEIYVRLRIWRSFTCRCCTRSQLYSKTYYSHLKIIHLFVVTRMPEIVNKHWFEKNIAIEKKNKSPCSSVQLCQDYHHWVLWLIHIAGSGLGFGLPTLWLHSIIQNFSHWFRSGSGSLSLSICIVQEYVSE